MIAQLTAIPEVESCDMSKIVLADRANLSLYKTHFQDNKVMDSIDTPYWWYGLIGAQNSVVEIQDSTFSYNMTGGVVSQNDGNLTIVNTKVEDSVGIGAVNTVTHIVNTGIGFLEANEGEQV